MAIRSTNRRGERVLRTGQTGDQLIGAVLVIVIAAAIALIGVDVNESIQEGTDLSDLDGEDVTVTNESFTVTFTANTSDYTVSDASRAASFDDDEKVFNGTGGSQLDEGTGNDYEWFTNNGTVRVFNGSNTVNNTDLLITYNYTETSTNFNNASDEVGTGFADAMGLVDVVFIVILFAVILGALLAFRR